jgi:hypothetical protein
MTICPPQHDRSMPDVLCAGIQDALPLTGMVPMYLLMSTLHLAPWPGLLSSRPSGACST